MTPYILTLICPDQAGIIAKITQFLYAHESNILDLDQHSTQDEESLFFMRCQFSCPSPSHAKTIKNQLPSITTPLKANYQLHSQENRARMGIMVSQHDHCLHELLYQVYSGSLNVKIPFIISNHPTHQKIAEHYQIDYHHIPANPKDRKESEILDIICPQSDFVVLARYMQILSADFLNTYNAPIINIHHSFLPSFKGAGAYEQAYKKGVKLIGATAHYVTAGLDEGPIITQTVEQISHRDDISQLKEKGKTLEKTGLLSAIKYHIDQKVIIWNNKTIVF